MGCASSERDDLPVRKVFLPVEGFPTLGGANKISLRFSGQRALTRDWLQRKGSMQPRNKLGVFKSGCWAEGRPRPPSPQAQAHLLESCPSSHFLDCSPWGRRHWHLAWAEGHVDVVPPLYIPGAARSPRPFPFLRTGSLLAGSVPTNSVPVQGS